MGSIVCIHICICVIYPYSSVLLPNKVTQLPTVQMVNMRWTQEPLATDRHPTDATKHNNKVVPTHRIVGVNFECVLKSLHCFHCVLQSQQSVSFPYMALYCVCVSVCLYKKKHPNVGSYQVGRQVGMYTAQNRCTLCMHENWRIQMLLYLSTQVHVQIQDVHTCTHVNFNKCIHTALHQHCTVQIQVYPVFLIFLTHTQTKLCTLSQSFPLSTDVRPSVASHTTALQSLPPTQTSLYHKCASSEWNFRATALSFPSIFHIYPPPYPVHHKCTFCTFYTHKTINSTLSHMYTQSLLP